MATNKSSPSASSSSKWGLRTAVLAVIVAICFGLNSINVSPPSTVAYSRLVDR
jgi:hypothetical protein